MACTVKRNIKGEIETVLAENGKDSILYQDLVSIGLDPEAALRRWSTVYTPTFKRFFADSQAVDENNEPLIGTLFEFETQPEETYYQSDDIKNLAKKWNVNTSGFTESRQVPDHLMKKDASRFGLGVRQAKSGKWFFTKNGRMYNPWQQNFQENAEEVGQSLDEVNAAMETFFQSIGVDIRVVDNIKNKEGKLLDATAKADMLNKVVDVVLNKTGIDTLPEEAAHFFVELLQSSNSPLFDSLMRNVENYQVYQDVLNSEFYQEQYQGDENMLRKEAVGKLIAKHILNQLVGTETPQKIKRVDSWFDKIMNFIKKIFSRVVADPYSRAAYIMLNEKVSDFAKVENLDELTGTFYQEESEKKAVEPAQTTLEKLKETQESFVIEQQELGERADTEPWLVEPGSSKYDRYIGKPGTQYAGVVIKGRPSDLVRKMFYKKYKQGKLPITKGAQARKDANNKMRQSMGQEGHAIMEELVQHYANGVGVKNEIKKRAANLFTSAQFEILDVNIKSLVKQIKDYQKNIDPKGKVTILTEQIVHNKEKDIAGTMDVMALYSDNSADIYDFKFISGVPQGTVQYRRGGYTIVDDLFDAKMDSYNMQIGYYKQTLLNDYGVNKVNKSRIVPIYARHKTEKVDEFDRVIRRQIVSLQMGLNRNGKTHSEYLRQLPVAEEMTDYARINESIEKLTGRYQEIDKRIRDKKYQAGETFEQALAKRKSIGRQIRKLQLDQDLGYVIKSLQKDLEGVEERIEADQQFIKEGEVNPLWMSLDEMIDLNTDLLFYQSMLGQNEYLKDLLDPKSPQYDPEKHKETIALIKEVAGIISIVKNTLADKMKIRVRDNALERGVKGTESFNTDLDYMTGNFVNLSKQNNPMLRNLWEIVDDLEYKRRKESKAVAAEIQELQNAVMRWYGSNSINAFDKLINTETGNFIPKYDADFYAELDQARKNSDSKWFKKNTYLDEESYNKNFKKYRDGKLKFLRKQHGTNTNAIQREILAWDKMYDVKNYYSTASLLQGGKYFLRFNEDRISQEFKEIQNIEPLKNFYEYYTQKVREIEDKFGKNLGPGFIAEIQKSVMEAQIDGGSGQAWDMVLDNLQIREHDLQTNGMRDINTQELIREIPRLYIRPITDQNGNRDPRLKSKDLGKGLLLLYDAAIDYQMKMEVLPEVLAMETLLQQNEIHQIDTDGMGEVTKTLSGTLKKTFTSQGNSKIFTGFVDQYFYGNALDVKDRSIKVMNKKLSMVKTTLAAKQYHSMMALGLKVPVAAGAFMAGMFSLEQQASKSSFISRKNLRQAQAALMKADPKMRALAEHFEIYNRSDTRNRADKLSADKRVRHMTNDKWFAFLSTADQGIDAVVLYAMALDWGLDQETGEIKLLKNLPEGSKSVMDLMEYKENSNWKGLGVTNISDAAVDRYTVNFNLDRKQERSIRNISRRISDKVKGTMNDEDVALYNNNFLMRFMMHYKSWLPGIAMERFGATRYDHILKTFDQGTWKTMFSNLGLTGMTPGQALDTEVHLMQFIQNLGADIAKAGVDIATFGYANAFKVREDAARIQFERWALKNSENPEFADRLKDPAQKEEMFQDFVKMQQGNIKAFLMEARLTLLFLMLLALMGGDSDDDGKIDMRESYAGRKLYNVINRTYREVAVFTSLEVLEAGRVGGIPILSLGEQLFDIAGNTLDETRDDIFGENSNRDKTNRFHYTFKMLPGLNAFARMLELSDSYKYSRF